MLLQCGPQTSHSLSLYLAECKSSSHDRASPSVHAKLSLSGEFVRFSLWSRAAAAAKSLPSCPSLCDPRDGSPPGSPVPGILQARTLEWLAVSFSNAWKWKVKGKSLSRVRLLATPWTAAHQASPSMGFSRQEYWSGVPLPSPIHFHFPVLYSRNIDYLVDYLFYIQYYAYVTSDFLVYLPSHHCTTPPPYHFW